MMSFCCAITLLLFLLVGTNAYTYDNQQVTVTASTDMSDVTSLNSVFTFSTGADTTVSGVFTGGKFALSSGVVVLLGTYNNVVIETTSGSSVSLRGAFAGCAIQVTGGTIEFVKSTIVICSLVASSPISVVNSTFSLSAMTLTGTTVSAVHSNFASSVYSFTSSALIGPGSTVYLNASTTLTMASGSTLKNVSVDLGDLRSVSNGVFQFCTFQPTASGTYTFSATLTSSFIYGTTGVNIVYSSPSTGVQIFTNGGNIQLSIASFLLDLVQLDGGKLTATTGGTISTLLWNAGEVALPATVSAIKVTIDGPNTKLLTGTLTITGNSVWWTGEVKIDAGANLSITTTGSLSTYPTSGDFSGDGTFSLAGNFFGNKQSFTFPKYSTITKGSITCYETVVVPNAQVSGITVTGTAAATFNGGSTLSGALRFYTPIINTGHMSLTGNAQSLALAGFSNHGTITVSGQVTFDDENFIFGDCTPDASLVIPATASVILAGSTPIQFGCLVNGTGTLTIQADTTITSLAMSNLIVSGNVLFAANTRIKSLQLTGRMSSTSAAVPIIEQLTVLGGGSFNTLVVGVTELTMSGATSANASVVVVDDLLMSGTFTASKAFFIVYFTASFDSLTSEVSGSSIELMNNTHNEMTDSTISGWSITTRSAATVVVSNTQFENSVVLFDRTVSHHFSGESFKNSVVQVANINSAWLGSYNNVSFYFSGSAVSYNPSMHSLVSLSLSSANFSVAMPTGIALGRVEMHGQSLLASPVPISFTLFDWQGGTVAVANKATAASLSLSGDVTKTFQALSTSAIFNVTDQFAATGAGVLHLDSEAEFILSCNGSTSNFGGIDGSGQFTIDTIAPTGLFVTKGGVNVYTSIMLNRGSVAVSAGAQLDVFGQFIWNAGTLVGPGTLSLISSNSITSPSIIFSANSVLQNAGSLSWSLPASFSSNTPTAMIKNLLSGTLTLSSSTAATVPVSIDNRGSIVVSTTSPITISALTNYGSLTSPSYIAVNSIGICSGTINAREFAFLAAPSMVSAFSCKLTAETLSVIQGGLTVNSVVNVEETHVKGSLSISTNGVVTTRSIDVNGGTLVGGNLGKLVANDSQHQFEATNATLYYGDFNLALTNPWLSSISKSQITLDATTNPVALLGMISESSIKVVKGQHVFAGSHDKCSFSLGGGTATFTSNNFNSSTIIANSGSVYLAASLPYSLSLAGSSAALSAALSYPLSVLNWTAGTVSVATGVHVTQLQVSSGSSKSLDCVLYVEGSGTLEGSLSVTPKGKIVNLGTLTIDDFSPSFAGSKRSTPVMVENNATVTLSGASTLPGLYVQIGGITTLAGVTYSGNSIFNVGSNLTGQGTLQGATIIFSNVAAQGGNIYFVGDLDLHLANGTVFYYRARTVFIAPGESAPNAPPDSINVPPPIPLSTTTTTTTTTTTATTTTTSSATTAVSPSDSSSTGVASSDTTTGSSSSATSAFASTTNDPVALASTSSASSATITTTATSGSPTNPPVSTTSSSTGAPTASPSTTAEPTDSPNGASTNGPADTTTSSPAQASTSSVSTASTASTTGSSSTVAVTAASVSSTTSGSATTSPTTQTNTAAPTNQPTSSTGTGNSTASPTGPTPLATTGEIGHPSSSTTGGDHIDVDNGKNSSSNIGPIVGGVVGGLVALVAIAGLVAFFLKRRRNPRQQLTDSEMSMHRLSRQSTRTFGSDSDTHSQSSLPTNVSTEFEGLLLKNPLISLAFLTIANRHGFDEDTDLSGVKSRHMLYDCIVLLLSNTYMTYKTGIFDQIIKYEVESHIAEPNKMWQENEVANLSLNALGSLVGKPFLDIVSNPILLELLHTPELTNSYQMKKKVTIQFLKGLLDNRSSIPQEIRSVVRLILEETKRHPAFFTLPSRSVANFLIQNFLVPEIRYMSTQPIPTEAKELLNDVAMLLDMVANSSLTTFDEETNTIVNEIRSAFTSELAALYEYLDNTNAKNMPLYKREEENVPLALQKVLEVFALCHEEVEYALEQSPGAEHLAEDIKKFFATVPKRSLRSLS